MGRFYFHVRKGDELIPDEEGRDLASLLRELSTEEDEAGRGLLAGEPVRVAVAFAAAGGLVLFFAAWAFRGMRRAEQGPREAPSRRASPRRRGAATRTAAPRAR